MYNLVVAVRRSEPRAVTDRLDQRVLAVCDSVGAFIEAWGFKSIHGRIWSLLALSKAPMPQTEIAEMLSVSRSLVSLAISELTDYGLVRATSDNRNSPYEARLDVWPTITDVLRQREWMLMERARVALESAVGEAEFVEESGQQTRWAVERIRLVLAMTEFAQATLRTIMSVRMPRSLDTFSDWLVRGAGVVRKLQSRIPDVF